MKETRVEHTYYAYGRAIRGFGSSMDPHRCGDPDEPCTRVVYEREVTPWVVVSKERVDTSLPQN